jgi:hypothetical protein
MSSKSRLIMGVAGAGLLLAAPAIARVFASRTTALSCVPAPAFASGNYKIATALGTPTPAGMPTGDWGGVNMGNATDLGVFCPVQLELALDTSRTVHDVSILAAGTSDVKCAYYMLDTAAGGSYSSPDFGGASGSMTTSTIYTHTPSIGVQVASPTFTRQFFYCTLPKTNPTPPFVATGVLRALEVRYDE